MTSTFISLWVTYVIGELPTPLVYHEWSNLLKLEENLLFTPLASTGVGDFVQVAISRCKNDVTQVV